jgi:tetratricopeptide (TPR) repeat protein
MVQEPSFIELRAERLLERGRRAVEVGDYVTALNEFRASAYVQRTAASLTNWGSMEHCLGDSDRAIELCREAIALDPDWGSPYNNIGTYYVALGREDDAIPWFQRAVTSRRFDGHRHVPHVNLGKIFNARREYERALSHVDAALALEPASEEALELARTVRQRLGIRPN